MASLFNFVLEYDITRIQINQSFLTVNGTREISVYIGAVNILGGCVNSIKEKAEALLVVSKESGLDVNDDETKYMIMS